MPILQSIQQAEEKAQSLRNNANLQVQNLIKEKRAAAEKRIAELNAQTLDEIKNSEAYSIKSMQEMEKDLETQKQVIKDKLTAKAMQRMEQAVALMMKKVGNI
ncbi:MAG: hypothetical protein PHG08_02795 [Bacilli bacterium]|jgi:cell division septum initiation protein DivIVA|nr:hypothetical protein [Bacilli bacterium]HHU23574.1 hypothetical protein [Acholeplasmataceae bacterium]